MWVVLGVVGVDGVFVVYCFEVGGVVVGVDVLGFFVLVEVVVVDGYCF